MAKRKTVIIVETRSLTILRTGNGSSQLWCAACGAVSQMLTIEQAASLFSITQRAIYRMAESQRVHFIETLDGRLLICAESLRRLAEADAAT